MTHRSQATPTHRQATQTTITTTTVISERGTTSATEVATEEEAVATTTRIRMLPIKRRAKKASRTILGVETITTQAGEEESLKCTTSRRSRVAVVVAVGIRVLQQHRRTRL